jgi:hypothetical protein
MAGGGAAGFFGGNLIDQEILRDAEYLQQAFNAMLGEYDNTMNRMADTAWQLMASYNEAVESVLKSAIHVRQEKAAKHPASQGVTKLAPIAAQLRAPVSRGGTKLAPQLRLLVVRGSNLDTEYYLAEGDNLIGRSDGQAVDIDLTDQEPADNTLTSRQHAVIICQAGRLFIEDRNSRNGTFVNRCRVQLGQRRPLQADDVIQVGGVHLKVLG